MFSKPVLEQHPSVVCHFVFSLENLTSKVFKTCSGSGHKVSPIWVWAIFRGAMKNSADPVWGYEKDIFYGVMKNILILLLGHKDEIGI